MQKIVDFIISMMIMLAVMFYYDVAPTLNLLFLPILVVFMMMVPAGLGFWFSSMAIRYRDVKFAMPFVINMLIYSAPILYSASAIPEAYRFFYSLNPIVGVIESFRSVLLGLPIPWDFVLPGLVINIIIFVSGAFYFKRMERIVVDVI